MMSLYLYASDHALFSISSLFSITCCLEYQQYYQMLPAQTRKFANGNISNFFTFVRPKAGKLALAPILAG